MSRKINYAWWRKRLKIKDVPEFPVDGLWLPVSKAAEHFGVSKMTIRHRYLRGKLTVIRYENLIYVNIPNSSNEL